MVILQNPFVKIIVIPILLTFLAALFETVSKLVRGIAGKGSGKYKAWVEQPEGIIQVMSTLGAITHMIKEDDASIIEIEQMSSFSLVDYNSIGISLSIGAIVVDVTSLINKSSNPVYAGCIIILHLFFLAGVLIFVSLSHQAAPEEQSYKRRRSLFAMVTGLVAMIMAFAVIGSK